MSAPAAADPSPPKRLGRWLNDDRIVRIVFYALLGGAAVMLWLDFRGLQDDVLYVPGIDGPAILPAVERPEIDPNAPQFLPRERVTADNEILLAPLTISLKPGGILLLEGTIDPGAAARFAAEIAERGEYVMTVALNSPGGSVDDALSIASLIREKGYATEVGSGGFCASSCPLIFAGGEARRAGTGAAIGVHQAFAGGEVMPGPAQAMSDAQATTARIARHLDAMGIDPEVWVHALETPPDRLYYFSPDELIALNLATEIVN
ncbi:MAG: ATP-dependent Clp protease proteolytic subunit [Cucumibacter sp.]